MKSFRLYALACAVLLAAAAGTARADEHVSARITAKDFHNLCQANAEGPRNACGSLLEGFIEVYVLLGSKDPKMRVICPPRRLSNDQARFLFNGWAEKRNDLEGMDVATAINLALTDSFRCVAPPKVK